MAAITAMKDCATAANSVYSTLAVNDASAAMTKIIELQKPPAHSPAEIAALQTRLNALEKRDGDTLIANALADGKLTPAQKPWAESYFAQNPDGFRLWLNTAPVILPLAKTAAGDSALASTGGAVMTDVDRSISAALGVSEESYKKHNALK